MHPVLLAPVMTPHGHLSLAQEDDALALDAEVAQRLQGSFERGAGHGLLQLGASEVGTALPAVFSYWREFAARYVTHSVLTLVSPRMRPTQKPRKQLCRRRMRSWSGWPWPRRL